MPQAPRPLPAGLRQGFIRFLHVHSTVLHWEGGHSRLGVLPLGDQVRCLSRASARMHNQNPPSVTALATVAAERMQGLPHEPAHAGDVGMDHKALRTL